MYTARFCYLGEKSHAVASIICLSISETKCRLWNPHCDHDLVLKAQKNGDTLNICQTGDLAATPIWTKVKDSNACSLNFGFSL